MITTYVILSRVRKADSLLLMRAFSPYLFRLGSAPGPYCLLKLLRHRFSGAAQKVGRQEGTHGLQSDDQSYGPEQAIDEYKTLSAAWEAKKKLQKTEGMEWQCCACGHLFHVDGYSSTTADPANSALQELRIAQGHWRRCRACKNAPQCKDESRIQCQGRCGQSRDRVHF